VKTLLVVWHSRTGSARAIPPAAAEGAAGEAAVATRLLQAPEADAADLLASPDDLARVRVCAGSEAGGCGWLFLDRTKARTRRWCSMQDCGNRAKARRYYAKVKSRTT
jgi:predicted RNA-binding Zn ribbon-like protein